VLLIVEEVLNPMVDAAVVRRTQDREGGGGYSETAS